MSLNQNEEESDKAAKIAGLILLFMFILYLMMLVKQSLVRNLVMLPDNITQMIPLASFQMIPLISFK
jgi:hypothetical protein